LIFKKPGVSTSHWLIPKLKTYVIKKVRKVNNLGKIKLYDKEPKIVKKIR
jgi:hypothetical protein